MTDATGTVVSQTRYKAWGEVRHQSGVTPTEYGFTGQFSHAADFGLMFYNARWYDVSLGRFAQADSIIPPGVQGLDRYAYVNNSPMNYVDPSGHVPCDEEGICYNQNGSYQSAKPHDRRRSAPNDAEKRVMSLLGFGENEYRNYWAWAFMNNDLNKVLLSVEAGDIIRFNYTNEHGNESSFDWMIMEYGDGYTFYDPKNRSRIDSSNSPNFANVLANVSTGAGEFNPLGKDSFEQGITTPGFATSTSVSLPENWNKPIDGGIIVNSTINPAASIGAWSGTVAVVASVATQQWYMTVPALISAVAGFSSVDTVPKYKNHPYGP